MCAEKRRKFCDNPANIEDLWWEPGYVYTYHVYQHLIDFSTFKLNVGGFFGLDIAFALNGQPLQVTIRDLNVSCRGHGNHGWGDTRGRGAGEGGRGAALGEIHEGMYRGPGGAGREAVHAERD